MASLRRLDQEYRLGAAIVALSAAAGIALWTVERTPAGRYLSHHSLDLVRGEPQLLPWFLAGWMLMVAAMMLPIQLRSLVRMQRGSGQARPGWFGAALVAGYLGVWTLVGAVVLAADWLLHQAHHALPILQRQAWALGALSLVVAGVYQLTPAKRAFLDRLRCDGQGGVPGAAHGTHEPAIVRGARHGLCCAGCCWSLMLLMFGAGASSWVWMLALGTIMALEQYTALGRRLVAPLGVALVVSGALVLLLAAPAAGHGGHLP